MELASYARVVDLAAELSCGSSVLAAKVCELWDTPKDEHKLVRLAEDLLNVPERFENEVAQRFALELARRLALSRPDYASRLIDAAGAGVDHQTLEVARTWLRAGEFLRTQSEAVRFFWQRHMRVPNASRDLKRMSARIALDAVRRAPVDEPVMNVFRDTVPEEAWEEAPTPAVAAVEPVALTPLIEEAVEQPSEPVATSEPEAPRLPFALRPSLMPAYSSNADDLVEPSRFRVVAGHPLMGLAAVALLVGSVVWMIKGRGPDKARAPLVVAETKVLDGGRTELRHQTITPGVAPQEGLSVASTEKRLPVPAEPKAAPTVPVKAPAVATVLPEKPAVAKAETEAVKPEPPTLLTAQMQTIPVPPTLTLACLFEFPWNGETHHRPPLRAAGPSPSPLLPSSMAMQSAPVVDSEKYSPPEPGPVADTVEVIAKPMTITDYDRWVMKENSELCERYPELKEMQQAVVTGNWTSTMMRLGDRKHITQDRERYLAVLRWLVIDPPIGDDTRRVIFEKWATDAPVGECLGLWEKMLSLHTGFVTEISSSAGFLLRHRYAELTEGDRERVRRIASLPH